MARVVLAMSGGVDSSVAASLLKAAGHEVIGLFMRHGESSPAACAVGTGPNVGGGNASGAAVGAQTAPKKAALPKPLLPVVSPSGRKQGCCSASDAEDARRVADQLDIPFFAVDFQEEFGRIMDYFTAEYSKARTPNPCVVCNNWLKFGRLWDYAQSIGAEHIATGHYARILPFPDGPGLCRGVDASKDQSYVLFGIRRDLLDRLLFPVGEFDKPEIRAMAAKLGMRVADKKDSQEICFVPNGDYAEFVRKRRGGDLDLSGELVTTSGEVVGRHDGIEQFTIGQRKGLGVAFGEPKYVVRIEADTRRVVVGTREDLATTEFFGSEVNWLVAPPICPIACEVKIRYLSERADSVVRPLEGGRIQVSLSAPKHGVAPGQAVVMYDGDRVLGGAWIE